MNKLLSLSFCVLAIVTVIAQTPQAFNYQAVVRNSSGEILPNQNTGFRISILKGSVSGTSVFTETHAATTNDYGLVTLRIGMGTVVSGDLNTVDWGNDDYFIKIEIDATGGTNYQPAGTSQLLSVPYALHAEYAANSRIPSLSEVLGSSDDANSQFVVNVGKLGIGTGTPAPGAALDIESNTGALLLPRMTTTERDSISPVQGMCIYNTDENKFQGYTMLRNTQVSQTDSTPGTCPSIVAGVWGGYQSFTAPSDLTLDEVVIAIENDSPVPGILEILAGDGTTGSVLHSQNITYPACSGPGPCDFSVTLASPLSLVSGNQYTLKFSATSGALCCKRSLSNPYPGGIMYQNTTAQPGNDIYFILNALVPGWANLH